MTRGEVTADQAGVELFVQLDDLAGVVVFSEVESRVWHFPLGDGVDAATGKIVQDGDHGFDPGQDRLAADGVGRVVGDDGRAGVLEDRATVNPGVEQVDGGADVLGLLVQQRIEVW